MSSVSLFAQLVLKNTLEKLVQAKADEEIGSEYVGNI